MVYAMKGGDQVMQRDNRRHENDHDHPATLRDKDTSSSSPIPPYPTPPTQPRSGQTRPAAGRSLYKGSDAGGHGPEPTSGGNRASSFFRSISPFWSKPSKQTTAPPAPPQPLILSETGAAGVSGSSYQTSGRKINEASRNVDLNFATASQMYGMQGQSDASVSQPKPVHPYQPSTRPYTQSVPYTPSAPQDVPRPPPDPFLSIVGAATSTSYAQQQSPSPANPRTGSQFRAHKYTPSPSSQPPYLQSSSPTPRSLSPYQPQPARRGSPVPPPPPPDSQYCPPSISAATANILKVSAARTAVPSSYYRPQPTSTLTFTNAPSSQKFELGINHTSQTTVRVVKEHQAGSRSSDAPSYYGPISYASTSTQQFQQASCSEERLSRSHTMSPPPIPTQAQVNYPKPSTAPSSPSHYYSIPQPPPYQPYHSQPAQVSSMPQPYRPPLHQPQQQPPSSYPQRQHRLAQQYPITTPSPHTSAQLVAAVLDDNEDSSNAILTPSPLLAPIRTTQIPQPPHPAPYRPEVPSPSPPNRGSSLTPAQQLLAAAAASRSVAMGCVAPGAMPSAAYSSYSQPASPSSTPGSQGMYSRPSGDSSPFSSAQLSAALRLSDNGTFRWSELGSAAELTSQLRSTSTYDEPGTPSHIASLYTPHINPFSPQSTQPAPMPAMPIPPSSPAHTAPPPPPPQVPHPASIPPPPAAFIQSEVGTIEDAATEAPDTLPGYTMGRVVGEGGFCKVRLAIHHLTSRKVAIKIIDKQRLSDPNDCRRISREIRVLHALNHECIIKLYEAIETPKKIYLVMQYAAGGSLLDYVRSRKRLPEAEAVQLLQQVVVGLVYCHQQEVVHRDIKLENILLDSQHGMKIIDFGLAAFLTPGKKLHVHCGSPSYAAPEIVGRKHYDGPPVDVWSLGVVLFAMVCGYLPFHASNGNKQELCQKILSGQYTAPDYLSDSMKDLLSRMLTVDVDKRITFDQILQHPWVRQISEWQPTWRSMRRDGNTGVVQPSEEVLQELQQQGCPRDVIFSQLQNNLCNYTTAAYHLLAEAKGEVDCNASVCMQPPSMLQMQRNASPMSKPAATGHAPQYQPGMVGEAHAGYGVGYRGTDGAGGHGSTRHEGRETQGGTGGHGTNAAPVFTSVQGRMAVTAA